MIKYKLLNYEDDMQYVDSLLESSALAHGIIPKTHDWFIWKYTKSPYGRSILVCALDGSIVVGCVALGMDLCSCNGLTFKAVQSYENFVHPSYQRRGIFKRMINLACEEADRCGAVIGYCFPNSNSLRGYVDYGWHLDNIIKYKVAILKYKNTLTKIIDLQKPFVNEKSNIEELSLNCPELDISGFIKNYSGVYSVWNSSYIKWRFFSYPNGNYLFEDNEEYFAIARSGYRGRLREVQIILVYPKKGIYNKDIIRRFINFIKKRVCPDFISITLSVWSPIMSSLPISFVSVPNHVSFVNYTWRNNLGDEKSLLEHFAISAVNFHTY